MLDVTIKMYDGTEYTLLATDDQLFGMLQVWGSGEGLLVAPRNEWDARTPIDKVTKRRWIHPRDVAQIIC